MQAARVPVRVAAVRADTLEAREDRESVELRELDRAETLERVLATPELQWAEKQERPAKEELG